MNKNIEVGLKVQILHTLGWKHMEGERNWIIWDEGDKTLK